MKLSSKFLLGFGGLWLLFLIATIVSMNVLEEHGQTLDTALHSNFDSVVYCEKIKRSLDEQNQLAMNAVWTHTEPSETALTAAEVHYKSGAEAQKQNITLPGEAEMSARLFELSTDYQNEVRKFAKTAEAERQAKYQGDLLPRYLAAQSAARSVIDLNLDHMKQIAADLRKNSGRIRFFELAFVGAGAALAIASILVLRKTILAPLRELTKSTKKVEAGDFGLRVPVKSADEIGVLAAAFNAMAERLEHYRRLDDARLSRLQRTLQLALDSLPDAVAVINPAGEVEISNHQARTHFALEPGSRQKDIDRGWLRDLIKGPLESGQPVQSSGYSAAIQLFDAGEERYLLPRAVPILDDQKKVHGVVVTLVDVTLLRQADEIKSDLLATASHELKTPLAAARFAVHVLAQQGVGTLTPSQARLVAAARDGTDRLHRIIENLLDLSRIEAGRGEMQMSPAAPQAIVEQTIEPLRSDFGQKDIALKVEIQADVPQVRVDVMSMNHALTNLITNALKFTPAHGTVRVRVLRHEDSVRFMVEDTGPGIHADHLPRIFDRFYRAPMPGGPPGAGLGLAIAKEIVSAHVGNISAGVSEMGGAAFVIELPVAK